jgi:aminocarboxymuconate-semialdehyde decarboxylase
MSAVIDVHTHMLSDEYLDLLRRYGAPTYTFRTLPGSGEVIDMRGAPFFTLLPEMLDYPARIRAMDAAGVDISIVSLTCPNAYLGDAAVSQQAASVMNDSFAAAQTQHPDRIRWYASLPWQHSELAIAELKRAVAAGAVGVMVIANIDGRSLTDPAFADIWAEIDEAELPVLVHPGAPPGIERLDMAKYNLAPPVGFVFDTTLAVARCMYDGFFDRYTRLKMIAAHGGGALPFLIGRLDRCYEQIGACRAAAERKPSDYMARIYLDAVVYDAAALRMCVGAVGPANVLYGSDYPHNIGDMVGCLGRVNALDVETRACVRGGNAMRLFRL